MNFKARLFMESQSCLNQRIFDEKQGLWIADWCGWKFDMMITFVQLLLWFTSAPVVRTSPPYRNYAKILKGFPPIYLYRMKQDKSATSLPLLPFLPSPPHFTLGSCLSGILDIIWFILKYSTCFSFQKSYGLFQLRNALIG